MKSKHKFFFFLIDNQDFIKEDQKTTFKCIKHALGGAKNTKEEKTLRKAQRNNKISK